MKTFKLLVSVLFVIIASSNLFAVRGVHGYEDGASDPYYVQFGHFVVRVSGWGYDAVAKRAVVHGLWVDHHNSVEVVRFEVVDGPNAKLRVWYRTNTAKDTLVYMVIRLDDIFSFMIGEQLKRHQKTLPGTDATTPEKFDVEFNLEEVHFRSKSDPGLRLQ